MTRRASFITRLVMLLCAAAPILAGAEEPLDAAERLLAMDDPQGAYGLVEPLRATRAGDPRFDYVFALAALGSGRAALAIEPLRRVLAAAPQFDGARIELAAALAAAGDRVAARIEYERLVRDGASALTRELAARGVAALDYSDATQADATQARAKASREFALLAGAGYDSNANAATSESAFLGFQLDPRERRQGSAFTEIGVDLGAAREPGSVPLRAVARLRAGHRLNVDARGFDQTVVDGAVTLEGQVGRLQLASSLYAAGGLLGGRQHFTAPQAELAASLRLGDAVEWAGLARAIALDYRQPDFEPLDVRRYVWGGAVQGTARAGGLPVMGLALIGGRDLTRDRSSPFSNDRWGARLFGARTLRPGVHVHAELSWMTSDFFGSRGFAGIDRLDRQWTAVLGAQLQDWPLRGWAVGPELRAMRNESNVAVFDYERVEVAVFLRRALR